MNRYNEITDKFFQLGSFHNFVPEELCTIASFMPDESALSNVMKKTYIKHETARIKNFTVQEMQELLVGIDDLRAVQSALFKSFMSYLVTTDKVAYPLFVHDTIADMLVKQKCKKEYAMMQGETKAVLQEMARGMNMTNFLNLSKEELCRAIGDLNNLAKAQANHSLTTCYAGLSAIETKDTSHLEGKQLRATEFIQQEYRTLKNEMATLNTLLDQWQQISFYQNYSECSNKNMDGLCIDLFGSLHEFSSKVKSQANRCNDTISNLKRQLKIGTLDDNAGIFSKLKAHFF